MLKISAVVLAAGPSSRMGRPKMLLPWDDLTVIQSVVRNLLNSGLSEIIVVTGAYHNEIQTLLTPFDVNIVFNPDYDNGEMLASFQVGLKFTTGSDAVLLMLGDQPQIQSDTIQQLITSYTGQAILIPSYNMRRGHPWILHNSTWSDIFSLNPPETLRGFMKKFSALIEYVNMDTPTILQDIDTPEDYQRIHLAGQGK